MVFLRNGDGFCIPRAGEDQGGPGAHRHRIMGVLLPEAASQGVVVHIEEVSKILRRLGTDPHAANFVQPLDPVRALGEEDAPVLLVEDPVCAAVPGQVILLPELPLQVFVRQIKAGTKLFDFKLAQILQHFPFLPQQMVVIFPQEPDPLHGLRLAQHRFCPILVAKYDLVLRQMGIGVENRHHQHRHTQHRRRKAHPQLLFLPVQHKFHPLSRVSLAEGQGRGQPVSSGGEIQQALGVVGADGAAQLFQHRLVTAQLHVPAAEGEGHPHQRIEPVDAHRQPEEALHDGVSVADVEPLVEEDVRPLPVAQARGQVDGPPEHEGGGDVVTLPDAPAQGHGLPELPF